MPREGVGVALDAHMGHVVTYRGSPEGPNLHRFYQKVLKTVKKGVPPVFDHFWEDFGYQGTPHPRVAPRRAKSASLCHPSRPIWTLGGIFSRWGYQVPEIFKKYHI